MSDALRGRNRLVAVPSLVMIVVIYLPFAVPSLVDGFADRWLMVGIGAYLCLSMLSRNLWLGDRMPEWLQTVWAVTEWVPWYLSLRLVHNNMPITLAGFAVVGEITLVGWHRRTRPTWVSRSSPFRRSCSSPSCAQASGPRPPGRPAAVVESRDSSRDVSWHDGIS